MVALDSWDRPDGPPQLLAILPGDRSDRNFGAAVDIGTTTVTVWLVDLESGEVVAQAADYNGQIARGEDVISRIIYAKRDERLVEMQQLVVSTINRLLEAACRHVGASPDEVFKVTIAGNTTMIHLLLAIPPDSIRLAPYIPVVNHVPSLTAGELGLVAHPQAIVDCLPGVASYVGADISAGVLGTQHGRDRRSHAVHRRGHERRDGAGQRRLACHLCLLGRPGIRGRGCGARHAGHRRRHRRGVDQQRHPGTQPTA